MLPKNLGEIPEYSPQSYIYDKLPSLKNKHGVYDNSMHSAVSQLA